MPDRAIGLMAKFPIVGRVKTRLAATTGVNRALAVYEALLVSAVSVVTGLDGDMFHRAAFVDPDVYVRDFSAAYPGFDQLFAQTDGDLGVRMRSAFDQLLARPSAQQACLIGADIPDLDPAAINLAHELLKDNDLVLGPTTDGGYYLIALNQIHDDLFTEIPWGTSVVLERTIAVAARLDLRVALLDTLRDLDDAADLDHFESFRSLADGRSEHENSQEDRR